MTADGMRIDDRQLDEALRTIAVPPAPPDLPARVVDAIREEAPRQWWANSRPALGVAMGVMVITLMALWMRAPATPREAQGSRRMAQGPEAAHLRPTAPPHARTSAPHTTRGSGLMAHGAEPSHLPTAASSPPRTTRPEAQGSGLRAQALTLPELEEVPLLDAPDPLIIARLQTPELSEGQLHVNALHVPALEIETLER